MPKRRSDSKLPEPPVRTAANGDDYVLVEQISEYLRQHGYHVVRATWPEHEPRPLLIVADDKAEAKC